jgi:hypothetical protein
MEEINLAEEGRVIEYIEEGVPKLGLLLQKLEEHERESKALWIVGSQDARKFALTQAKFSYVWPELQQGQLDLADGMSAQAVRANAKQLSALAAEAAQLRSTVAPERMQALWEQATSGATPGTASAQCAVVWRGPRYCGREGGRSHSVRACARACVCACVQKRPRRSSRLSKLPSSSLAAPARSRYATTPCNTFTAHSRSYRASLGFLSKHTDLHGAPSAVGSASLLQAAGQGLCLQGS